MVLITKRYKHVIQKVARKATWDMLRLIPRNNNAITRIHEVISASRVEFVDRCAGPIYIEPMVGYVISNNFGLYEHSLFTDYPENAIPSKFKLPSARHTIKEISKNQVMEVDSVISLRHIWEWNYYHFHKDVLGKLSLFDSVGIDRSTPIVLGRYALELPFVKEIIKRGQLGNRNWIIQDGFVIKAKEAYFCRSNQPFRDRFHFITEMDLPLPDASSSRRVYLTRGKGATRRVENEESVIDVVKKYGFDIVDTAEMSIDDQIKLFSSVRFLVGIHGAGMVNIIYRQAAPLSILEICPSNYHKRCFQEIADAFGYRWELLNATPTSNVKQHTNMVVDCDVLETSIRHMVSEPIEPAI